MTIEELLKDKRHALRLTNPAERAWLLWDSDKWVVVQQKGTKIKELLETDNLQQALEALVTGREVP